MDRRDRDEAIDVDVPDDERAVDRGRVESGPDAGADPDSIGEDADGTPRSAIVDSDPAGDSGSELADELGRIAIRSTPEGYVEGRVTDVETVDGTTVRLAVGLPHGRTATFTLEKPIPWSEEFLLARLVERLGYDAASIDHVVGETVYVARADLEEEGRNGFRNPLRAATDFLERELGTRFGRSEEGPTWRLVDPRELPEPDEETRSTGSIAAAATVAVVLGAAAAVLGAVVGATGGVTLSAAVAAYAFPGFLLLLAGLFVLRGRLVEAG